MEPTSFKDQVADILVVDDTPENLNLLIEILSVKGYDVRPAGSGEFALSAARLKPPDLVLLDIKMPFMDGYAVCEQLKADEKTRNIPVIFISALDQTADKVKAFQAGGVDYISKPFQAAEVLARIETHLMIRHLQEKLELKNQKLVEQARLREGVEHVIYHDLKGPLHAVLSYPTIIKRKGELNEHQTHCLKQIEEAGSRMLRMVEHSLDLLRLEKGEYQVTPESVDIVHIIREILNGESGLIKKKELLVDFSVNSDGIIPNGGFKIWGEEMLCYSILSNLIQNAIEASSQGSHIKLEVLYQEKIIISIHNDQPVPEGIRQQFFHKYITAEKYKGTGLGTYMAKLATETLGGSIHLQTSDQTGTSVFVHLPEAPN
jgi:two-component system sensor histidine kinase/response regulator